MTNLNLKTQNKKGWQPAGQQPKLFFAEERKKF